MAQKCRFFTTFFTKFINFLGFGWNISTNEPVLDRLLNFSIPVQARKPPKVKKLKISVARKPDLIGPN
jgi:hypothetical protein